MTIFGIDVSHHQRDLDLRNVDVDFVMAKVSEGVGFRDPQFDVYRAQAEQMDVLFAGYHFLRGDSAPGDQARVVAKVIGTSQIPVIIDIEETNGTPQPTMTDARVFRDVAEGLGVRVSSLIYFPEWYWNQIGRPDTGAWSIWQSDYGSNAGVYPTDASVRWNSHGRVASILQYTSKGRLSGYAGDLDINAFRGTRAELASKGWFYDMKESEVATKTEIQQWVATTPIKIDDDGTTWPLQQVLRDLRRRVGTSNGPTAEQIANAVVAAIPPDNDLTRADVKEAVTTVFRDAFGA
jgi:GH25 family lysozyme M1 (1,4-beta-N-acetylmuramidase)